MIQSKSATFFRLQVWENGRERVRVKFHVRLAEAEGQRACRESIQLLKFSMEDKKSIINQMTHIDSPRERLVFLNVGVWTCAMLPSGATGHGRLGGFFCFFCCGWHH